VPSDQRQVGGRQFSLVRGLWMRWEYDQEPMSKRAVAIEVSGMVVDIRRHAAMRACQ
jgi:hypothetical protein